MILLSIPPPTPSVVRVKAPPTSANVLLEAAT